MEFHHQQPYRDWPPKGTTDEDEGVILGAPIRDSAEEERRNKDPITGECLTPFQHKGPTLNPTLDLHWRCKARNTLRNY
jgi:hypothetical protein